MARVNGKKPPHKNAGIFVNSKPDRKQAGPVGKGEFSRGFILGCGAPLHATSTTGDTLHESCGSEVNGYMVLCPACMQTRNSFDLPIQVRVAPKVVK